MNKKLPHILGFTLVELAIVLVILTLLLSGMLIPIGAQIQNRRIADTQKTMEEIKDALIGYALTHRELPPPSSDLITGTAVTCSSSAETCSGFVPWKELGIGKFDAWGKGIRYSVDTHFTSVSTSTTCPPRGRIMLKARNSAGNLVNYDYIAAVLHSSGAKNFGTNEAGVPLSNTSTTNADEVRNEAADGSAGKEFITKNHTDSTAASNGEFDDVVSWLPAGILATNLAKISVTLKPCLPVP